MKRQIGHNIRQVEKALIALLPTGQLWALGAVRLHILAASFRDKEPRATARDSGGRTLFHEPELQHLLNVLPIVVAFARNKVIAKPFRAARVTAFTVFVKADGMLEDRQKPLVEFSRHGYKP